MSCVTCKGTHAVMWTIPVHVGRRIEERQVCNRCELEYRLVRSKR